VFYVLIPVEIVCRRVCLLYKATETFFFKPLLFLETFSLANAILFEVGTGYGAVRALGAETCLLLFCQLVASFDQLVSLRHLDSCRVSMDVCCCLGDKLF